MQPAIIVFMGLFLFFFIFLMWKYIVPIRLINIGEYDRAIKEFEKLMKAHEGDWKTKNQIIYSIANCLHRKGDFEESIKQLNLIKVDEMDSNLSGAYYGLFAGNLINLKNNLDIAEEYLTKSQELLKLRSSLLYRCYLEMLKGNDIGATELINEFFHYDSERGMVFGLNTTLLIDKKFENMMCNYLLGIYYLHINDLESAIMYLTKASEYRYDNYYSRKSKELLERRQI